jgi:polo-like kinase 1
MTEDKKPRYNSMPPETTHELGPMNTDGQIVIEHKKLRTDGEVEIQKFIRGSFLGKGGFAKCYEFTRVTDRQIFAGKNISKSSLTKSRAR